MSATIFENAIKTTYNVFKNIKAKAAGGSSRDVENKAENLVRQLTPVLSQLTSEYVLLRDSMATVKRTDQPCTYIDVFTGPISVGMFVLFPGSKIPLHDHPTMHGAIKVIHGEFLINSYSKIKSKTTAAGQSSNKSVIVRRLPQVRVSSESPPLVLTPQEGNFHELEYAAGENYAAFIDFLQPPYFSDTNKKSPSCNYYVVKEMTVSENEEEELSSDESSCTLQEIKTPHEFVCLSAKYKGPSLNNFKLE